MLTRKQSKLSKVISVSRRILQRNFEISGKWGKLISYYRQTICAFNNSETVCLWYLNVIIHLHIVFWRSNLWESKTNKVPNYRNRFCYFRCRFLPEFCNEQKVFIYQILLSVLNVFYFWSPVSFPLLSTPL